MPLETSFVKEAILLVAIVVIIVGTLLTYSTFYSSSLPKIDIYINGHLENDAIIDISNKYVKVEFNFLVTRSPTTYNISIFNRGNKVLHIANITLSNLRCKTLPSSSIIVKILPTTLIVNPKERRTVMIKVKSIVKEDFCSAILVFKLA